MEIIEYKEEFGAISFPDGFVDKLQGKTIDEQMEYFCIAENVALTESSYGKIDRERANAFSYRLDVYSECKALVVKDGIIVGVMMKEWSGSYVFSGPYKSVCTYSVSENDGSGVIERDDYARLICL